MQAQQLARENDALRKQIEKMYANQEHQKQRVDVYLTKIFAETEGLREEERKLKLEANNLVKEKLQKQGGRR